MFGKGIYFADLFSKSLNYTSDYNHSNEKTNRYMLLCEVALGRSLDLYRAEYIEKLPGN
jgi:hypothetical protein